MWAAEMDLVPGRTVAPPLYRFGPSIHDWATGVLESVGSEPLILVGCSTGGSCALEVAAAAPDRVALVVLVGAKAGVRPEPKFRDTALRRLADEGMAAAGEPYWRPLFGPNAPAGVVSAARQIALSQSVDDMANGVRAFHDRRDLTEFAMTWPRPIFVIGGAQDPTFNVEAAAEVTRAPNRAVHLVPDCGHYVNLEQPSVFRELITDAIERV